MSKEKRKPSIKKQVEKLRKQVLLLQIWSFCLIIWILFLAVWHYKSIGLVSDSLEIIYSTLDAIARAIKPSI